MLTLEELHAHYKAVRARLDNPVVKKKEPAVRLVYPEPQKYPEPLDQPPTEAVETPPEAAVIIPLRRAPAMPETPSQTVLREVAEKRNMSVRQIQSATRLKAYVEARQEAAFRLNKELGFSLKQVGNMLGRRDHTTVLHAIRRYEKNLAEGREVWSKSDV
jgi:hypothetical protein